MTRTTKADLLQVENVINNALGTTEQTRFCLEWAYGQPRLYQVVKSRIGEGTARREISPRLPTGQMYLWLSAFEEGIRKGYEAGKAEAEPSKRYTLRDALARTVKDARDNITPEGQTLTDVADAHTSEDFSALVWEECTSAAYLAAECDTATLLLMALEDRLSLAHCAPEWAEDSCNPDAILKQNVTDLCAELAAEEIIGEAERGQYERN